MRILERSWRKSWHVQCEFPDRACTLPLRAPPTVTQFTYARAQPHEILIRLTISDRRWTTVQVPFTGLRAGLHPTVEFAATPEESRRSGGAGEEPAVPLQHLRQGLRHGVQPPYSHVEGQSCMYQIRRPNSQKFAKNSRGAGILTEGVENKWKEDEIGIDIDLFRQSRVNTFANRSSNDDNLALTLSRATRSVTRTHAYGGGGFTLASIFSVDGFPFKRSLCIRRFLCSVSRAPYIIDVSSKLK